jgi:hypothetical protein
MGPSRVNQKVFDQILNIAGYYPDYNGLIPIFMIPVINKSQNIDNNIL